MCRQRAAAVIAKGRDILLIRRVKPDREYYTLLGGGVDDGESVEDALRREVMEELTLAVRAHRYLFSEYDVAFSAAVTRHPGSQDVHYFLIEEYRGTPTLGGEEKEEMTEANQYHIEWVPMASISATSGIRPRPDVLEAIRLLGDRASAAP